MTKRQHTIIAALLCCFCLPAAAQDIGYGTIEGQTVVHSCDLRELLHASKSSSAPSKVRQRIETDETVVNYRDRVTNMPAFLHDFCDQYVQAAQTVLDGGTSWLSDPTINDEHIGHSPGLDFYLLKESTGTFDFTFPPNADNSIISQTANDIILAYAHQELDSLDSFMRYTFISVKFDHPEVFWIGNGFKYDCDHSGKITSFQRSEGTGTVSYTIRSRFILRDNNSDPRFDIRNNGVKTYDFRNTTNIAKGVKQFKSSVQTILDQCQSKSPYKRLLKTYDWLTTHNRYNRYFEAGYSREQIGGTPWSPISALVGNNDQSAPVCEGYSRALKVICDTLGIPCILMSGFATTPSGSLIDHMWNYVQMEDGNWYALDPTWDDPIVNSKDYKVVSGYEGHKYFLVGRDDGPDNELSFIETHPEEWGNWGKDYNNVEGSIGWELLEGPKLSPTSYVLPDPCDPNGDGVTDMEEITMMVDKIANDDDDIKFDVDGNEVLTIGDLVRMINRYISK